MIGPYGIFASEETLDAKARGRAVAAMLAGVSARDFTTDYIDCRNFSLGMAYRKKGENKDLFLNKIDADTAVAFRGYGKFAGERRLYWAAAMAQRITLFLLQGDDDALLTLEGSFELIALCKGRLIILSDRMGTKSLFYYAGEELFVCAPDPGSILITGLVPKGKNLDAVAQVLLSGFFLDNSSLAAHVDLFPAATVLRKEPQGSMTTEKYWHVPAAGERGEITDDLLDEFEGKLSRAVHELADLEEHSLVPLSGGLDSRAIACFLAERQAIKTITYDLGDEVNIAKKVCKVLSGSAFFFSNDLLSTDSFRMELRQLVSEQKNHAIVNQYFYTPLFRDFFAEHRDINAIYDGVYLDILFSAPYTYDSFGPEQFKRTYGGSWVAQIAQRSLRFTAEELNGLFRKKYLEIAADNGAEDGVGISQQAYATGRLRRYVHMSGLARENYCYVLKPGYDYELLDFGYSLSLGIRKGILYRMLLERRFPEVMKIQFKDSYGNRPKTAMEKLSDQYRKIRLRLSSATNGIFPYSPFQADYFFMQKKGIDAFEEIFVSRNCIPEVFEDSALPELFQGTRKKYYLFNLFQRILFIQLFYARYMRENE